jgi:hypothetical protein
MRKDPNELIAQVVDETSFLQFLAALKDDWDDEQAKESVAPSSPYGPGANGWENGTIGAFLEAAIAWPAICLPSAGPRCSATVPPQRTLGGALPICYLPASIMNKRGCRLTIVRLTD